MGYRSNIDRWAWNRSASIQSPRAAVVILQPRGIEGSGHVGGVLGRIGVEGRTVAGAAEPVALAVVVALVAGMAVLVGVRTSDQVVARLRRLANVLELVAVLALVPLVLLGACAYTPVWRSRGTGPWISRNVMPTSKPNDQSAAKVTTPASPNRSPSR